MAGSTLALLGTLLACSGLGAWLLSGGGFLRAATRQIGEAMARAEALLSRAPPLAAARRAEELSFRRSACLGEFPVLLDVVTLGLSAGLSFDASLELYCTRYDNELSKAFSEAMLGWRIGAASREDALWALAEELGVGALRRFASVVGESLSFGSPLAEALERQAQAIRDEQRSQVEEEIERLPVKMLVPLGTLIVPAMFLAILGPLLGSSLTTGW